MYEGGVRVVGFVNSPLLSYKGAVHEGLVYVADWFSTLLNLAGDTKIRMVQITLCTNTRQRSKVFSLEEIFLICTVLS